MSRAKSSGFYVNSFQLLDIFRNEENLRIGSWQIETDPSIAIIKAQRQNFQTGFKDSITDKICNIPNFEMSEKTFLL